MQEANIQSDVSHGVVIDNRYQVLELVHPGHQEILTKAIDKSLENEIIFLKVFYVTKETSKEDVERFEREVIISRKLSHPNIARVYDLGKFDSCYRYITQANVKGVDLETYFKNTKEKLSFKNALDIIYRLTNAMTHAHENGILHRNICDSNVYVELDNHVLKNVTITNFGYGKLIGSNFSLTKTGEVIGLSTYTAPEQIRGEVIDDRADIYSIGMLAYELFSGEKPSLQSQQPMILRAMTIGDSLPTLSSINTEIPEWVDELIKKSTASDKASRFASTREMRDFILEHTTKIKKKGNTTQYLKKNWVELTSHITKKHIYATLASLAVTCILLFAVSKFFLNTTPLSESDLESSRKMFTAILSKDEPTVFSLLKEGVNPHLRDASSTPILILSVKTGQTNIAYTILSKDPETIKDIDIEGQTALMHAVISKNHEMVKLLMNFKANPKFADMRNKSSFDYANDVKDEKIKKLLLKSK